VHTDYYQYIQREEWEKRTEKIRNRDNGICEVCHMRYGQSVHHRTYEHLFSEREEELLHVCDPCHKMIHKISNDFIWESRVPFLLQLQKEIQ